MSDSDQTAEETILSYARPKPTSTVRNLLFAGLWVFGTIQFLVGGILVASGIWEFREAQLHTPGAMTGFLTGMLLLGDGILAGLGLLVSFVVYFWQKRATALVRFLFAATFGNIAIPALLLAAAILLKRG